MTITTREMILTWLNRAKAKGATHMIVVCDTFDHEDYPVFVLPGTDVHAEIKKFQDPAKMSRVMECYDMALSLDDQLEERRAWHT